MDHLLNDSRLKVARAKEHFDTLHREVREFFETNPCNVTTQIDPQSGEHCYKIPEVALPEGWGLILGDACGNARAALDHMVYALAIEGGGDPEQERTAFPIYESRDDYWRVSGRGKRAITNRDRHLVGVAEKWRRRVDDLQPYRRLRNAYLDPLALLTAITNRDKHRLVQAAHLLVETPAYIVFGTGNDRMGVLEIRYNLTTPAQPNVSAQAQGWRGRRRKGLGVAIQPKVEVDNTLSVGVIFGDTPRVFTLDQIKEAIIWTDSILRWFEPAFDPEVVAQ